MATNLMINDRLLNEAKKLGKFKTKRETVDAALDEFIRRRRQMEILDLYHAVDFDPAYDYKKARWRKAGR